MTHTKPPHKPFTKNFWILLSSSVLSLLLVYGGIVWAVRTFVPATECQGEGERNCIKIGAKGSYLDTKRMDEQTTRKLAPRTAPVVETEDTDSPLWDKQLVVSAYKATLPNGVKGNQKDGGLFRKVNICAKGGAVYTKNKISPYFVVNLQFVNRLRSSRIFITYTPSPKTTDPERWSNKCCMPKKLCVRVNTTPYGVDLYTVYSQL